MRLGLFERGGARSRHHEDLRPVKHRERWEDRLPGVVAYEYCEPPRVAVDGTELLAARILLMLAERRIRHREELPLDVQQRPLRGDRHAVVRRVRCELVEPESDGGGPRGDLGGRPRRDGGLAAGLVDRVATEKELGKDDEPGARSLGLLDGVLHSAPVRRHIAERRRELGERDPHHPGSCTPAGRRGTTTATVVADTATGLRRGLRVLEALDSDEARSAGGLGVLRLAELLGQDKSQVSRTLRTLDEHGFVDRDPGSRAYRLGWTLLGVAARAGDAALVAAAEPVVRSLARSLGERVHLSVLRGAEVLTVLSESSARALEAVALAGTSVPAYCTSAGYALLVDDDVPAALAGVGFTQRASKTPRSAAEVADRIELTRQRGYAVADEDFEDGLIGIAAPVRDGRGLVTAAVNVSGPAFRLSPRLDETGAIVVDAAARITAVLEGRER